MKNNKTARPERSRRVFVGMSGGVDSSVTAAILKDHGYNVVGVHLRCWNIDGCAEQDAQDARRAAETLGIPFYVFDFEKEYREKVVQYMVDGYRRGLTPNPDVMCNNQIKFGLFFDRAMELGADYVATGHYVRLRRNLRTTHYELRTAVDQEKDQSYFLWTLTQKQLARCLFPLGDLIKKTQVRRLAKKYQLPNADKKDSQGVCFLGHISLPQFLEDFIPSKKGKILDISGKVLGSHPGAHNFTIGQRKGLGIGGFKEPQYVVSKNIKANTVTIAPEDDPSLLTAQVTLIDINFINPPHSNPAKGGVGMSVLARIRYRQPLFPARLYQLSAKKYKLVFEQPQKFVAPGQSAVFYNARNLPAGRQVLGGGVIA